MSTIKHTINDAANIWFTSDTHFGHANIIQYTNRPYDTVEEMNNSLIANWNKYIKPDDIVYHLGDFCLGDIDEFLNYVKQLNGNIYILEYAWHHDKRWLSEYYTEALMQSYSQLSKMPQLLDSMVVLELIDCKINNSKYNQKITLCHYPLLEWEAKHYGTWHLYGHIHTQGLYKHTNQSMDVGVDNTEFKPISLKQVIELFKSNN